MEIPCVSTTIAGIPELIRNDVDGLLVAGRCISPTHEALASTRLTPTVMTLGQAAGTAAALSLDARVMPRAIDTATLRERLIAGGVDLRRTALTRA